MCVGLAITNSEMRRREREKEKNKSKHSRLFTQILRCWVLGSRRDLAAFLTPLQKGREDERASWSSREETSKLLLLLFEPLVLTLIPGKVRR